MQQVETKNPWAFRHSFNMRVDFCIWVLEKDGLQVAPFTAHPKGDGILQSEGFQAHEWKRWTEKIVQLQHQQFQVLPQQVKTAGNSPAFILPDAHTPATSWSGNIVIKKHIDELWEQYKPLSNRRRTWERPLAKQWRTVMQPLWNDLQIYTTRLPALAIYLVEYPQQIDYLIPPLSIIMTIVAGNLDGEMFHSRVVQAAENLARIQPL
jgi:hypothetical protein